ncbi:MAG: transposase [Proteobacteria bacterium]|nr:transposase [Pseudomonadota bacterium]
MDPNTRCLHDRDDLHYPSDLTDAEWALLAPFLPPPAKTGRLRAWEMRELINGIFFVLRGGDTPSATSHTLQFPRDPFYAAGAMAITATVLPRPYRRPDLARDLIPA